MTEEKKGLLQSLFGKKKKDEVEAGNESNPGSREERPSEFSEPLEITPAVIDNARLTLLDKPCSLTLMSSPKTTPAKASI